MTITLFAVILMLQGGSDHHGTYKPDLSVGDYVLVDRGIVVDSIAADEAQVILSMYREIGELLEAEDARA